MDEENNSNEQQANLDNNPVSQMEAKIFDKTAQQVKNLANNLTRLVKNMAMKAVKAIAKILVKIATKIIQIIAFSFPINVIVAVIILTIILVAYLRETFGGFSNILQLDMESGDVSTSEIASLYDQNTMPIGGNFTITATDDMVKIGEEVHNVIATHNYIYNTGNYLNYPELLYSQRFKRKCY